MASLLALSEAAPVDLAGHLAGSTRAQALSARLSAVDKQLGMRLFSEQRRSWTMSMPTESGEKVLKAFCFAGARDEETAAISLRATCMQRWEILADLISAKTDPVQFLIGSAGGVRHFCGLPHAGRARGDLRLVRKTSGRPRL